MSEQKKHTKESELKDLKISAGLKNFGQSIFTLYEPIIFYEILDHRIELVMIVYGLQSILFALLVYRGAKLMSKIGIKRNLIWGTIILILYNIALLAFSQLQIQIDQYYWLTIAWFILIGVILSVYQALYWPAYHMDLSIFIKKEKSGKEIGTLHLIGRISSIVAPLIGAFLLSHFGTIVLLPVSTVIIILSIIPLFSGPDHKPKISMSFFSFISQVFKFKNIKYFITYFAEGVMGYIGSVFWTLFVYVSIKNIMDIGWLASGVSLFTGIFLYILGKTIDTKEKVEKLALKVGALANSFGWLIKGIPTSSWMFFITDNIQQFGNAVLRVPYERRMYNRFKKTISLADEYIVVRSIAYHTAGGVALLLVGILMSQLNLTYSAFIIAALSSFIFILT